MYTLDEKLEAVKLYNQTKSYAVVKRMLGYPNSDDALRKWVKDYANGTSSKREEYTREEIEFAIEYYKECRSATIVIKDLGYPKTCDILYGWISKSSKVSCRERKKNVEYSEDEKKQYVKLFLDSHQSQITFSKDYDFTPQTLGNWIRRYSSAFKEETKDMPSNNIENKDIKQNDSIKEESQNNEISETETIAKLKKELGALKAEKIKSNAQLKKVQLELQEANLKVEQAQLEYDILEKAAELLKKEKGINIESLTNKEKAIKC